MKLSRLLVLGAVICAIVASTAQGQKIYGKISMTAISNVPQGTWIPEVCATSQSTLVNVDRLRWTLRRHDSHLKLMPGMDANCRRYYAPANTKGWERIKVTYRSRGNTYIGTTQFYITNPTRP